MVIWRQRRLVLGTLIGAILVASAGAAYAASAGFSLVSSIGGEEQVVTSPCSSVGLRFSPSYDADLGAYASDTAELDVTCPLGYYDVKVAIGTGGTSFVEKAVTIAVNVPEPMTHVLSLPSTVRASDISNVAVMVEPTE
ncbi:MAG: hypothetical protein RL338_1579 [Chloroflexota bacterium]